MRHHLLTKKWCSGIDGAVWFNEQKESLQEAKVQGRDYLARNAKQFQFFKILFDHQNVKPHPCSRISRRFNHGGIEIPGISRWTVTSILKKKLLENGGERKNGGERRKRRKEGGDGGGDGRRRWEMVMVVGLDEWDRGRKIENSQHKIHM